MDSDQKQLFTDKPQTEVIYHTIRQTPRQTPPCCCSYPTIWSPSRGLQVTGNQAQLFNNKRGAAPGLEIKGFVEKSTSTEADIRSLYRKHRHNVRSRGCDRQTFSTWWLNTSFSSWERGPANTNNKKKLACASVRTDLLTVFLTLDKAVFEMVTKSRVL